MKKKKIVLFCALAAVLLTLGLMAAHRFILPRKTGSAVSALTLPKNASLHIDTRIAHGSVHILVTNDSKNVYWDETLTRSYSFSIKAFEDEDYTVYVTYHDANADVDIYRTDENGTRMPDDMGVEETV